MNLLNDLSNITLLPARYALHLEQSIQNDDSLVIPFLKDISARVLAVAQSVISLFVVLLELPVAFCVLHNPMIPDKDRIKFVRESFSPHLLAIPGGIGSALTPAKITLKIFKHKEF